MKQFKRIIAMIMVVAMCAGLGITASAAIQKDGVDVAAGTRVEVEVGEEVTLTSTETTPTWSTGDSSIATVADGVVTGVAVGETTVTDGTSTVDLDVVAADLSHKIKIAGGDIDKVEGVTQNGGPNKHAYKAYEIFAGTVSTNASGEDELSITGWGKDVNGPALLKALKEDPRFLDATKAADKPAGYDDNLMVVTEVPPVAPATEPTYTYTYNGTDLDPSDAADKAMIDYHNYLATGTFFEADGFAKVASIISEWSDGTKNDAAAETPVVGNVDAFAEIVADNLKPNSGTDLTWDNTAKEYTTPNLPEGYYLIRDLGRAADKDDFISKNIIELLGDDVTIQPKGTIPTIKKGVIDADNNGGKSPAATATDADGDGNANEKVLSDKGEAVRIPPEKFIDNDVVESHIGDVVWFTLEGTLSSMINDYDEYEYTFVDNMSGGLDFGSASSAAERNALTKSVGEINKAKDDAQAELTAAQNHYNGLAAEFYPAEGSTSAAADKADVESRDAAAITAAQTAVQNAQTAVDEAQAAVNAATEQSDKDAKQVILNQKNADLKAAQDALTAAQNAQTAHAAAYVQAQAAIDAAQLKVNAAAADETARNNQLLEARDAGTISYHEPWTGYGETNHDTAPDTAKDGGEYKLLQQDRDTLSDVLQGYYDAAMAKIIKDKVDDLKDNVVTGQPATAPRALNVYLQSADGTSSQLIDPACYTVTLIPGAGLDGGDQIRVDFKDLKSLYANGGDPNTKLPISGTDKLVVTYSAVVNEDAVMGNPGNLNEAYLEYSRDPATDEKGKSESTPDEAVVYTFELDINKIDKNSRERLNDAGFLFFKDTPGTTGNSATRQFAKFIDKGNGVYVFDGWVTVDNGNISNDELAATKLTETQITAAKNAGATELLTTNNGHFEILGLQSGNYKLAESKIPSGYKDSDLGKIFKANISAEFAQLASEETVKCPNELNPNYIQKASYTTEESEAGIDKMYVDAYGVATTDQFAKQANPLYGMNVGDTYKDESLFGPDPVTVTAENAAAKYIATKYVPAVVDDPDTTVDETAAAQPATFTSDPSAAADKTMVLKTYKVTKLTLDNGVTPAQSYNTNDGAAWTDIENSLEVTLPETGGIGTTIFYIVGGILVVGAAVVMITRKRVEG